MPTKHKPNICVHTITFSLIPVWRQVLRPTNQHFIVIISFILHILSVRSFLLFLIQFGFFSSKRNWQILLNLDFFLKISSIAQVSLNCVFFEVLSVKNKFYVSFFLLFLRVNSQHKHVYFVRTSLTPFRVRWTRNFERIMCAIASKPITFILTSSRNYCLCQEWWPMKRKKGESDMAKSNYPKQRHQTNAGEWQSDRETFSSMHWSSLSLVLSHPCAAGVLPCFEISAMGGFFSFCVTHSIHSKQSHNSYPLCEME